MYISIVTAMVILTTTAVIVIPNNAYAGGPRYDFDERYENVDGAFECWVDGFDDGATDSYDEDIDNECGEDKGNQYNHAFNVGKE